MPLLTQIPLERQQLIESLVMRLTYDFTQYTLESLIDFLNQHRSKPIFFVRYPSQLTTPLGIWMPMPERDYVVVTDNPDIHPILQNHVCLHEIGHILLDHSPHQLMGDSLQAIVEHFRSQTPHPDPLSGRTAPTSHQHLLNHQDEQEAEYFAHLVTQRIPPPLDDRPSSITGVRSVADVLGFE